ncbi:MAG: A/G-specific adenine glycosylase [Propionibacterium sp.]|nr:A/G-specific adenine glycosylase [Propionibacterium sp.]
MPDLYPPLATWYAHHARDLPWRRPGFSAWGTLLSEVMLQQTQASRVAAEIDGWLAAWPTPAALAAAPTAEVLRRWGNLGYPRRAIRLQQTAQVIVEEHGGEVPGDVDALLALPGIGDYTARAVAVFHFGLRHPVVDTNVRRVMARHLHGLANQRHARRQDLVDAESLLPDDAREAGLVSAALMELGALVCTSRSPDCDACPLATSCAWLAAGKPDNAPPRARQARFEGSDRQARGRILETLRQSDVVLLEDLKVVWAPDEQRERAIEGLVADGLAVRRAGSLSLP